MQTRSSSSSDDGSTEPANKGAEAAEKERLLREIQELKCIVKQCEWSLQTLRFKDVEERVTKRSLQSRDVSSQTRNRVPNVEVDLQDDLYRFAGFRCVKFRRDEIIFNFTSTNEKQKDNTHAVQIFIKDGKGSLGKWVMPMSIDINYILSKTPVDQLKNLTAFIKNCKRNVDCYTARQEQFLSLQNSISHMKHCTLQSDLGFKQISLELYGVHDNESDRYIDLIIHLLYHFDKARPYKIEVNATNKSKLSDDTKQRLKICLKEFRISDLQTAFDKILDAEDNSTFTWTRADDSESLLELNDTSSSDEEDFLVQLQSDRKRLLKKRQKKRELQKKWNERKRRRLVRNITDSSEDDQEDSHSKAKVSRTERPRQIPIREKKTEKVTPISNRKKIIKNPSINPLEETTPMHKSKVKLKQTKLNFETHEATKSNTSKISLVESRLHNRPDNKQLTIAKLITSTPLRVNVRRLPLSPSLQINNITSIETTKKTANKLDDSKNSDQLGNEKTRESNNRSLRSSTKTTGLSPQMKRNQRLTRSMIKS
ncbi:uncharacterized protein LOC143904923 [Temnothorax americanus]|uniref:uncharacterized protein LOC143904923 n=1 Tax=Temnothorax americanus TaxID=1964332 RepID=UPI004067B53B